MRSFGVRDLLIGLDDAPAGWGVSVPLGRPPDDRQGPTRDSARIAFLPANKPKERGIVQVVYHYDSVGRAAYMYKRYISAKAEGSGNDMPCPGWEFTSQFADESDAGAFGVRDEAPDCLWTARYQEYVVWLSASLEYVTVQEVERIAGVSDRRMADALQADQGQLGPHARATAVSVGGGWAGALAGVHAGAQTGAIAGGVAGSLLLPGPGTVAGAAIGGLVGGLFGGIVGGFGGSVGGAAVAREYWR